MVEGNGDDQSGRKVVEDLGYVSDPDEVFAPLTGKRNPDWSITSDPTLPQPSIPERPIKK